MSSLDTTPSETNKKTDGGPAFPMGGSDILGGFHAASGGVTVRDYFAAAAMTGLIHVGADPDAPHNLLARHAYIFADAMLAERAK